MSTIEELLVVSGAILFTTAATSPASIPLVCVGLGFMGLCYMAYLMVQLAVLILSTMLSIAASLIVGTLDLLARSSLALLNAMADLAVFTVSLLVVNPVASVLSWMNSMFDSNVQPEPSAPPIEAVYWPSAPPLSEKGHYEGPVVVAEAVDPGGYSPAFFAEARYVSTGLNPDYLQNATSGYRP